MEEQDEQRQSALELLNIFPPALKEAFGQAEGLYNDMYGDRKTSVDPGRYDNVDSLQSEFARLTQPRKQYEPIGGHIPGNEFSVSLRGLSQGIGDMINAVDSKRREVRLFGDPQVRDEMKGQIAALDSEAQSLREQAARFKSGEISAQAMSGLGLEEDESINQLIAELESQADKIDAEKESLDQQLKQYSGVAGELSQEQREIQREEAETERNRSFMDDFVRTFGAGMYESALQTMRDAKAHGNAVSLQKIRDAAANERLRMQLLARPQKSDERIPNYANTKWIGDYLKNYKEGLQGEKQSFIQAYLRENPTMGTFNAETNEFDLNREMIPEEDLVMFNRFDYELRYLDDIDLARSFYADPDFDINQKSPSHHPTQQQKGKIEAMRQMGMPSEFIQAYMYYNNLSYSAPPLLPQEATRANQAQRPFRFLNENDIERQRNSEKNNLKLQDEEQEKRRRKGGVGGSTAPAGIGVIKNKQQED